jgi:UDP-GlcNAc:undecaprenyl-phosphate/decaprenyl-phosphate GlcNAc-1-phosphate transferase
LTPVVAVPSLLSLALAAALAPAALALLGRGELIRANYRGARLPCPIGVLLPAAACLALAAISAVEAASGVELLGEATRAAAVFVVGVSLLGLIDDLLGTAQDAPRGVRSHLRALARGRPSTGVVKAVGTVVLALGALSGEGLGTGVGTAELLISAALLTLATHTWNLLDLRPGRAIKALLLLGAAVTLGSRDAEPLTAVGPLLTPFLVLLPLDLRERGMLGDAGASAAGAVAGLLLVLTLSTGAQAIALGVLGAFALVGEVRSLNAAVDRSAPLRRLDSLGRA